MTRKSSSFLAILVAGSIAACSQSSGPTDTGPGDGTNADAATDGGADSNPMDAQPEASPGGPFQRGTIEISQVQTPVGSMTFYRATEHASIVDVPADAGVTLDNRTDGPCQVTRISYMATGDAGLNVNVSAGVLTFAGGMGAPVDLMPMSDGTYADGVQMMNRWMGGDMITVSAAGATVPAFQAMVTYPPRITVTSPTMPAVFTTHIMLNRTSFTTQWMSTGSGTVGILIAQAGTNSYTEIGCLYPFGDGMGTVPATTLMDLQPGQPALVAVGATNSSNVMAGTYPISVSATNVAFYAIADVQ